MGRVSVPIMNKTGFSMYWNSAWDDKTNYTRSLKDGIFIKEFMHLFFEGGEYSTAPIDLKNFKKKFGFLKKRYFFHTKKYARRNIIESRIRRKFLVKRKNKFKPYLSKIWILKYQTWVVVYFYSYSFNLSVFFKKNFNLNKKFLKHANVVSKYYSTVFKLKYNFKLFKKSFELADF